ncbi:MAG: hypothetical protein K9G33_03390 [Sneathiella sp.]|nr:hypothetical protein [Sneathiella sp.]
MTQIGIIVEDDTRKNCSFGGYRLKSDTRDIYRGVDMWKICLVLCFISVSAQAFETEDLQTGDSLLRACESDPESSLEGFANLVRCFSYVKGIVDGATLTFDLKPEARMFCVPKQGISVDQSVRVVVKHLKDHPEDLHKRSLILAYKSLILAFPCKK